MLLEQFNRKRNRLENYDYSTPNAYFITVWQKGFYDHVIRGDRDHREIWNYIEGNPYKWAEDELFIPNE